MRRPRPPREIPPPLELECLKALWVLGEGNVKAVQQHLEKHRRLAYTTVMTLLERLTRKGVVSRRKVGRAFLYTPLVEQDTMRRKAIEELAGTLFDGSETLLLRYLTHNRSESAAQQAGDERLDAALL